MILNPAVIALLSGSVLVCFLLLYASFFAIRILRKWDLRSGSELQLVLERRTYLIATVLSYAFGFELVSLFLYIHNAEQMHTLFVGAMCAAGTLYVNDYGYPALLVKAALFILAGVWLIMNYADNRAWNYPLIRKKYALLLFIVPVALTAAVLQGLYLLNLKADVITSCCGSLFSQGSAEVRTEVLSLSGFPWPQTMYPLLGATLAAGTILNRTGRGGYVFGLIGTATFTISLGGVIAYISPYIYELPTHRCPFCLLQSDYHYIGYPLYLTLFTGVVTSVGAAVLTPFKKIESLREALPRIQKRLALISVLCFGIFTVISIIAIMTSNLAIN